MIQRLLPKFLSELNDPRYFQILYLGSFLFYGISYLGWDTYTEYYLVTICAALLTQTVFIYWKSQNLHSLKSGIITALGLCLLLHTTQWWVGALAAAVAISSKFLIRNKGKHIFNPANIGIIAAIVLTNVAWISPGQWGSSTVMWFFIGSAGLMMILKVGRLDTAFTFFAVFGSLLFIYNVLYLGWGVDVWLHKMSNGTLLLFAFFMITDPRTTPNHFRARMIWSILLGTGLFILSSFLYIQTAAVWLLFLISPFTPLFDKYFKAEVFQWKNTTLRTT